jgi:hypothetical protein
LSAALDLDFDSFGKQRNAKGSVFLNPSTLLSTEDKHVRKAAEVLGIHANLV